MSPEGCPLIVRRSNVRPAHSRAAAWLPEALFSDSRPADRRHRIVNRNDAIADGEDRPDGRCCCCGREAIVMIRRQHRSAAEMHGPRRFLSSSHSFAMLDSARRIVGAGRAFPIPPHRTKAEPSVPGPPQTKRSASGRANAASVSTGASRPSSVSSASSAISPRRSPRYHFV